MLNFFYDSLETLKKVKKPKSSDVWNLTLIIFIVVIIAALLFALMDGVFGEVYNFIYESLSGAFDGIGRANVAAPAIDLWGAEVVVQPTAEVVVEPAAEAVVDAVVPAPSAVDAAIDGGAQ